MSLMLLLLVMALYMKLPSDTIIESSTPQIKLNNFLFVPDLVKIYLSISQITLYYTYLFEFFCWFFY